jgi:hypothetical protein
MTAAQDRVLTPGETGSHSAGPPHAATVTTQPQAPAEAT